jgi:DNA polymerase elongation subunit (family B)
VKSQPSQYRRFTALDIETVALDPSEEKGALDAMTGRVVCIGMLFDNGHEIKEVALTDENESSLIQAFWNVIRPTDVLIGHNLLEFDLMFLRQRSWILGIKPTRTIDLRKYYSEDIIDTMQMWSNWGFKKFVKLEELGDVLGCGCKTGHGTDVAQWWAVRDLDNIKAYCLHDVRLTYAIYCRLTYQQPRMAKPQAVANVVALGESA